MQHIDTAFDVIEDARKSGGCALIHCIMGVNRSGALAVACTMVHQQWGLGTNHSGRFRVSEAANAAVERRLPEAADRIRPTAQPPSSRCQRNLQQ